MIRSVKRTHKTAVISKKRVYGIRWIEDGEVPGLTRQKVGWYKDFSTREVVIKSMIERMSPTNFTKGIRMYDGGE